MSDRSIQTIIATPNKTEMTTQHIQASGAVYRHELSLYYIICTIKSRQIHSYDGSQI
jgi:hypothetical protein